MITSIFKKSTPINYSLLGILMVLVFFLYQFHTTIGATTSSGMMQKVVLLGVLFASLFFSNFIVKKNGLTKDSSYTILFYFLFLLFFPKIFNNVNLLLANFFILLSMRRLISLQTLKSPKGRL